MNNSIEIIKTNKCQVILFDQVIKGTKTYFDSILKRTKWRKDEITLFGKTMPIPRQQAWYGDPGMTYTYSKIILSPENWYPEMLDLKKIAEQYAKTTFNSVLVNYYETGKDYSAWHADNEKELGKNPLIASISLGATRNFQLRQITTKETYKVDLKDGSLLIMAGETQHHYKHQLAKTAKDVGPRINLTFRKIIEPAESK